MIGTILPPLWQKCLWHEISRPAEADLGTDTLVLDHDGIPPHVRTVFRKVLQCRTPALGAEVFASENGELIVYHTCKSRTCPSCGHWATMKWQQERLAALPRVVYKGITLTMPKPLWRFFHADRSLADALPAFAADAIEALILAGHRLRAGVIAILHTFNGLLEFNSHVHTMVTAGGLQRGCVG